MKKRKNFYTSEHSYLDQSPQEIKSLILSAVQKRDLGELEAAELIFENATKKAKRKYGAHSKVAAMCQYYYADCLGEQGKHFESIQVKLELQAAEADIYGSTHSERVGTVNNIAFAFEREGDYNMAELFYQWAIALDKKNNNDNTVLYNYGCFLFERYRGRESLNVLLEFVNSREKIEDDYLTYANALGYIAKLYVRFDSLDKAEKYYLESIKHHKKHSFRGELSNTYHNMGKLLIHKKQWKRAVLYYKSAIEIDLEIGNKRSHEALISYRALASTHFKSNHHNEALEILKKSYKFANSQTNGVSRIDHVHHLVMVDEMLQSHGYRNDGLTHLIRLSKKIDPQKETYSYMSLNQSIAHRYQMEQKWKMAIRYYKKLLNMGRNQGYGLYEESEINYLTCLIEDGQIKAFKSHLRKRDSNGDSDYYIDKIAYLKNLVFIKLEDYKKLGSAVARGIKKSNWMNDSISKSTTTPKGRGLRRAPRRG